MASSHDAVVELDNCTYCLRKLSELPTKGDATKETVMECADCGCRFCSTKCCDFDTGHKTSGMCLLAGQAPGARPLIPYYSVARRFLSNAPNIDTGMVEVHQSPIHGRGVFAVKDIPAGTIISLVPLDGFFGAASPAYGGTITPKEAVDFRFDMLPDALVDESCMNTIVWGSYSNPHNVSRPRFLAHMVNDAATPPDCEKVLREVCPEITDEAVAALSFAGRTKVTSCLAEYWQRSLKRNNAVILFNHNPVLLVSRRDIKAGNEILISYGPAYWLQQAAGVQLNFNILEWVGPALLTFGLKLRATLETCAQEEEGQMKFAKKVAVVASLAARRAFMAKGGSLTEVTDPGLFGEMVGLSNLVGASKR